MLKPDISFIHKYFLAEKQAALLFLIIGTCAVIFGIIAFFFVKNNPAVFKGAAIPVAAIGLIMGIVGTTVYQRSDKQRKDTAYEVGLAPVNHIKGTELPRMEKVMNSFRAIMIAEVILLVAGILLFLYFRKDPAKTFWKAFGLSLSLIVVVALLMDYLAEKRAKEYKTELKKLIGE